MRAYFCVWCVKCTKYLAFGTFNTPNGSALKMVLKSKREKKSSSLLVDLLLSLSGMDVIYEVKSYGNGWIDGV